MQASRACRLARSLMAAMLVLALMPASALATTVWAPEVSDGAFRIEPLGHVGSGYPQGMCVDGTTVYVASITGFSVFDASDPAHPRGIADYVTPDTGDDLVAKDGKLYVGSGPKLLVFDVSDPSAPSLISSVTVVSGETVRGVALIGDVVYCACDSASLVLVDVSSPADPAVLGGLEIGDAVRISAEATRAYVYGYGASGFSTPTLTVADVTDPAAPVLRGTCELSIGGNNGFAVKDGFVYLPFVHGFDVVDARDATAPFVTKTFDQLESGNGVISAAADDSGGLFLTDWSNGWSRGLQAWDASVPASPAKVGTYADLSQPSRLKVSGGRAYVIENGGLTILDVTDRTAPALLGRYHPGWAGASVRTAGTTAYYADWLSGLVVADLTTPTAPEVVGQLPGQPGWGASALDVAGDRGYVGMVRTDLESGSETYSLDVADLTTPTAPARLASLPSTDAILGVAFSGGHAFAACDDTTGLRIADVSDPENPAWVGALDVGWARDVTVAGTRAYITSRPTHQYSRDRLVVADISDPAHPSIVGTYEAPPLSWFPSPWVGGAAESGGRVYVSVAGRGLVVLDRTTLAEVGLCTFMLDPGPVYIEGDTAYVCSSTLHEYDVSNPDAPVLKGFVANFSTLNDVRPAAGQLFATVGPGLFTGEWTPTPTAFERLSGQTRFGTSAAISKRATGMWGYSPDTVILATGANYPDALAGTPLAYLLGAPLLLTTKSSIPASVTAEIERLGATHAIILGSDQVVDEHVVDQLHSIFGTTSPDAVGRISGPNRYATAAAIAEFVFELWDAGFGLSAVEEDSQPRRAFIATGRNYPDALSAAGLAAQMGYPILLTDTASVPAPTSAALESLDITGTIVLGSNKAVSDGVYAQVHGIRRLSGANRYDTSRKIAEYGITDAWLERGTGLWPHYVWLATGLDFPDALSAGQGAAMTRGPLLLVKDPLDTDAQLASTRALLSKYKLSIGRVFVVGGPAAVPESVVDDTRQLVRLDH